MPLVSLAAGCEPVDLAEAEIAAEFGFLDIRPGEENAWVPPDPVLRRVLYSRPPLATEEASCRW